MSSFKGLASCRVRVLKGEGVVDKGVETQKILAFESGAPSRARRPWHPRRPVSLWRPCGVLGVLGQRPQRPVWRPGAPVRQYPDDDDDCDCDDDDDNDDDDGDEACEDIVVNDTCIVRGVRSYSHAAQVMRREEVVCTIASLRASKGHMKICPLRDIQRSSLFLVFCAPWERDLPCICEEM
eukprot:973352-Amphidinium_carterae.2